MKDSDKAIAAIVHAIAAIDEALADPSHPSSGPGSADQLARFRHQFVLMLNEIQGLAQIYPGGHLRRVGPIITDSWPLGSELGDVLLRAENEYVRYKMTSER